MRITSLLLLTLAATAAAAEPTEPESALVEPALPLNPKVARSENDELRTASAAFFAEGRLLLQRQNHPAALRRLQRAWRYNPDAVSLLPEIVFLANDLKRREEAARYAVLAAERVDVDPLLLRQLAMQLDEQQQWHRAVLLYERAWKGRTNSSPDQPAASAGDVVLQMEMGRLYFLADDYPRAAALFGRVRDALEHPERISQNESLQKMILGEADRTYRILAEGFLQAGRPDDAAAMFRKAHETARNAPQLAYQLARVAAKRGQHAEALKQLEAYFGAKGTSEGTEPYALLAEELRATAKDEAAAREQLFAKLVKLHAAAPDNAALAHHLADTYLRAERWAEAEALFRKLYDQQATLESLGGLAEIYRHRGPADRLLETLGRCVLTAKSFRPLEQLDVKSLTGPLAPSALVANVRQRVDDKEHPPSAGDLLAAGWLALAEERRDVAEDLGRRGLEKVAAELRGAIALSWALGLLEARRFSAAANALRRAVDEEPDAEERGIPQFYLARSLALAEKPDEALQVAEKLAAAHPDSPRFQSQPAWVLYQAKRYDEAERRYVAVLNQFDSRQEPAGLREALRDIRLALSNICVSQKRTAQSEEWLEQVLDEFPEDIGALNDLGYLWTDQRKYLHRALTMIQQAVRGEPSNRAYIDSLGWSYYQLGRYPDAVAQLEKAAADESPDGVVLDHLGDAYSKANQRDKALAAWKRAADAFQKHQDSHKLETTLHKIKAHEK